MCNKINMTCLRLAHPVSVATMDLFSDGREWYRWCNTAHLSLNYIANNKHYNERTKTNSTVIVIITRTFRSFAGRNAREMKHAVLSDWIYDVTCNAAACARRKLTLIELCAPGAVALFNIQYRAENYHKQSRSPCNLILFSNIMQALRSQQ